MEDDYGLQACPSFRRTQSCRVPKTDGTSSIARLTYSQKQSLLQSWRCMRPQAAATFRKILIELEVASPKVKQIFYKAALVDAFNKEGENNGTLDEHIKLCVKFFDDLFSLLDDEAEALGLLRRVGGIHAMLATRSEFSSDVWEKLGEIAMERICTMEAVQKTREAARAWRTLLACVVDQLRTGFDADLRNLHRNSVSTERLDGDDEDEGVETETADLHMKLRELRLAYDSTCPADIS